MSLAVYNEIEPFAADWLENLIRAGHVAPGRVERRSIVDLQPADVVGPGQRHFFAGIGVWSYALRLAGVPDDLPVWTGSCPCQPFSAAGKRGGTADARHLWPEWFRLIRECRPAVIFGEQVASKDGLAWLDAVHDDLEGAGYAVGAADTCAAGVGAPHIRQRIYFVAYADEAGLGEQWRARLRAFSHAPRRYDVDGRGAAGLVADDERDGSQRGESAGAEARAARGPGDRTSGVGGTGDPGSTRGGRDTGAVPRAQGESDRERGGLARGVDHEPADAGAARGLANSDIAHAVDGHEPGSGRLVQPETYAAPLRAPWEPCDWIPCSDGKSRPVEPGTFPLAHGVAGRVGRLRAYGNAIVAEQAATFIEAAIDAVGDL